MLALIALLTLLPPKHWHPYYSEIFRADPSGPPNHRAVLSWYGTDPPFTATLGGVPGQTMLDLYVLPGDGTKSLATSTKVLEGVYVESFTRHSYLHCNAVKANGGDYNMTFFDTFFAAEVNGGQYDHTIVWLFDRHSWVPIEMLNVLLGDVSRLDQGIVVENSPANYVNREDWPKGVKSRKTYLCREWKLGSTEFAFKPGPWRLKKE